ncbi:MAG: hypothetical protein JNL82_33365 [Myxococcales bacterium]|nr:hypothetical protein [Myxococcales bacterium]
MASPGGSSARWALGLCGVVALCTCQVVDVPPDPDELRLPTGAVMAPSGQWLLVVNSNLDEARTGSTLTSINLAKLWGALKAEPLAEGGAVTDERPCRISVGEDAREVVECDARRFIAPEHTVEFPSGGGNIGVDFPTGAEGPMRLLIPSSIDRAVTWIDVLFAENDDIEAVACGQKPSRCAEDHVLTRLNKTVACADGTLSTLPGDPGRIAVGTSKHRYAYLPHLLGAGLTLIALNGANGPELTYVACGFFDDGDDDQPYDGGFSVVERSCDPTDPLDAARDCSRPTLLTTYRFQPAVRMFAVRTGGDDINPQNVFVLGDVNSAAVEDRPEMGDLQFEDPATGERLLVVRTTPPALTLASASVDEGALRVVPIATAELCRNPNILTVYRPPAGEKIAFVSCYSDDQVAAVMLGSLATITIDVDDGPNDMVVDYLRDKLYVINTQSSTISIVELRRNADFLRVVGRVGLTGG